MYPDEGGEDGPKEAIPRKQNEEQDEDKLFFEVSEGYSPCEHGFSVEGIFSKPIDILKVSKLIGMLGRVSLEKDSLSVDKEIVLFPEGALTVKGRSKEETLQRLSMAVEIILRTQLCVRCGVCISACRQGCLKLEDVGVEKGLDRGGYMAVDRGADMDTDLGTDAGAGGIVLEKERCTGCYRCLEYCPVTSYMLRDICSRRTGSLWGEGTVNTKDEG